MMTSQKTTRTMNSQCEPRELAIDIESYSSVELKDCGAYKYAASPDFEILLIAYKFSDEDDVKLIDCIEELIEGVDLPFTHPEFYEALIDPGVIKTAYNANFERTCFAAWLQEEMPATQWLDTMVLAASLGLPRSLAAVGEALGLGEDEAKLRIGKALINYFCKPCRPTKVNGGRTRNYPKDAPEKWEQFKTYNVQDVVTEQAILQRLKQWRPDASENALWALDQKINDRGVRLDIPMAEVVVEHDTELRDRLKQRAVVVSGLDNPNSLQQLTGWLDSYGIHVDSLAKDTVARLLSQELPAPVREVLTIRQSLGKTSVKKYQTMINMAGADDRARGTLMFYGGHTGRWSGKGLQPQNLSKNEMPDEELDLAHDLVKAGDFESVEMIWGAGTTSDILSQLVRTAFIPSEGCRFVVSDFSAIEARVIAWLAGEQWRLDVFENGGDIYCASASQMFGVPVEKNGVNGHMRKQGKIAELALGYGGSVGAIDNFDRGGSIPEEDRPDLVKKWRAASPNITALWNALEKAAIRCVRTRMPVELPQYYGIRFRFERAHGYNVLFIDLPNGRPIAYWDPKIKTNKFDKSALSFMHVATGKWVRGDTFGGRITENVIQSIARDCLAEKMKTLDEFGYNIAFHVHDEVILDVPTEDTGAAVLVDQIMGEPISWAPGLPLKGGTYECNYYRKD